MGRNVGSKLGWAILDAVADGVEVLQYATYRPTALLKYGLTDLKTMDILRERQRMRMAVRRLEKRGYLERVREDGLRSVRLTELGDLMIRSRREPRLLPDGIWTVVSFDIPERNRGTRRTFRTCLRASGFTRRHDSVWISNRDWSDKLRFEVSRLGISDWVAVIIGEIINAPPAASRSTE
ncbi:hypothetical protein KJ781_02820 [Patescibacteria group bacterium]|nr:hypothetical protein [Patescibacteria group bacterium]MBU1448967.1 hypothetical protein [Patescibacteria group bacterium]MBU2613617.1 hypothetical protein [Patescibacteria group bacterium]